MNIDCSSEFLFQTSRSSGPGGQNVNKVNTKVELLFHIEHSQFFTTEQKLLLQTKLSNKISADGYLHIVSQTERSQLANKETCVEKFYAVIAKALFVAKKRKATKPTYTSKLERLDSKRNKSEIKNLRRKPEL
jgi:ribosome-associated protein